MINVGTRLTGTFTHLTSLRLKGPLTEMTKTSTVRCITATPPPPGRPVLSVARVEDLAILAGTRKIGPTQADVETKLLGKRNGNPGTNKQTAAAVAKAISAPHVNKKSAHLLAGFSDVPPDEQGEKLMALSKRVSEKPPASSLTLPIEPPAKSLFHKAVKMVGFKFLQAARNEDAVAYGYAHRDQRAVLITAQKDGTESWAVKWPGGGEENGMTGGTELAAFVKALKITTTKHLAGLRRTARVLAETQAKAAALAEAQLEAAKDTDVAVVAEPPVTQLLPGGPPDHVCRAIVMLGELTGKRYDMDLLRGDKHYGDRVALLRAIFNRGRGQYKASETGITNLTTAFYTAVGPSGKNAVAKSKSFSLCAADIAQAFKLAQRLAKRIERTTMKKVARVTAAERSLPGEVLPTYKRPSKGQRTKEREEAKQDIATKLAVSPEQPAVPHPDVDVVIVPGDLRLLEDPVNGLVMIQMERANSQGAICVYNNGSRVAAGVVPPETLIKLRPVPPDVAHGISGNEMLLQAANQLLTPIIPGVPVTPVAARHLTAVVHCKELIPMANTTAPVSAAKKFAPPAKVAGKGKKATPKVTNGAAVKAAHAKAEKSERVGIYTGKKIKVLNENHGARPGTKRAKAMDILIASKTTDEAIPKIAKVGANNSFIAFAIREGLISLS